MKKVLIFSYFFPPNNLTGAQRAFAWSKYLPEKHLYPIIITQDWDNKNAGKAVRIEKKANYEVHYLAQKHTFRDQLNLKNTALSRLSSKTITLFILLLESFFLYFNPFKHYYYYTDQLLKDQKDISILITTANPFELFQVCYRLKQKHTNINWIADYRDEWTTRKQYKQDRGKNQLVRICEQYAEKKYTSNAAIITTVTSYFLKRILNHTKQKGIVLNNGYQPEELAQITNTKTELPKTFSIVYSGTLYTNQPIQPFIEVFDRFLSDKTEEEKKEIRLLFLGSKESISPEQSKIVDSSRFRNNITILPRLERANANELLQEASLHVMFPYIGMEGIATSKLYDNLIFRKKIILYPSDNDIIQETLNATGLSANNSTDTELIRDMNACYARYKQGKSLTILDANISPYSRKVSTEKLAEIIHRFSE